jgi:hypothetical protein
VLVQQDEVGMRVRWADNCVVPSAPASTTKKRKNALDSDVDETPSKTRKTKKEGTPTSQANLATDSFEDYMNSLPDGADAFIMGERHWEEENLYA